jgi:lipopolysaccharide assembly protein A
MKFLKTLFWVILIIAFVIFARNNWSPVSVNLWNQQVLDTKLPMLLIISFFGGFIPLYFWHRVTHWRMKRRIATLEGSAYRQPLDLSRENIAPPMQPNEEALSI